MLLRVCHVLTHAKRPHRFIWRAAHLVARRRRRVVSVAARDGANLNRARVVEVVAIDHSAPILSKITRAAGESESMIV